MTAQVIAPVLVLGSLDNKPENFKPAVKFRARLRKSDSVDYAVDSQFDWGPTIQMRVDAGLSDGVWELTLDQLDEDGNAIYTPLTFMLTTPVGTKSVPVFIAIQSVSVLPADPLPKTDIPPAAREAMTQADAAAAAAIDGAAVVSVHPAA